MTDEDDDWSGYETGPFCRHWSDPSDCELNCVCGHRCAEHDFSEPAACMECPCAEYEQKCEHPSKRKYGNGPWVCTECGKELTQ